MCHFLGSIFLPWDVSIFYHHVVAIGSIRNLDTWVLWYVNPKHISRGTLLSICKLLTYQTQKRIKHQTNSEFVMKIVWRKSIASLHRLTQAVQRANLRRTAGDLTWVSLWNKTDFCQMYCNSGHYIVHNMTQVGSPAVRCRLARCTAWVKRWSEAMDFLQTIFKTNI